MNFGLVFDVATERAPFDRVLDQCTPVLHLAEELGFEFLALTEGFPTARLDGTAPSLLLLLAALANRTSLRLGTSVTMLPLWNPLRLAYDAASLDQISGGRLDLGVAIGHPWLDSRFGFAGGNAAQWMGEVLQALKALWTGQDGFEGQLVRIQGGVRPLPRQPGGPPLLVGGNAGVSVRRAARYGDGWISSIVQLLPEFRKRVQQYHAALCEAGKDPARMPILANKPAFVADTDERARAECAPYVKSVLKTYAEVGALHAPSDPDDPDSPMEHVRFDDPRLLERSADCYFLGSPDSVIRQVQRYKEAGATGLQFRVMTKDTPMDVVERSVTLLGQHVLPHFKQRRT